MKKAKYIKVEEEIPLTWEVLKDIIDWYDEPFNLEDEYDYNDFINILKSEGISEDEIVPFKDKLFEYTKTIFEESTYRNKIGLLDDIFQDFIDDITNCLVNKRLTRKDVIDYLNKEIDNILNN